MASERVMKIAGGRLVIPQISQTGAVKIRRTQVSKKEINLGRGIQAHYEGVKTVNDTRLAQWAQQIVTRSYFLCDKYCVRTDIGYWISEDDWHALDTALDEVRRKAELFNDEARSAGSKARVEADAIPVRLDMDDEKVAGRLARTVIKALRGIAVALRAGETGTPWETAWERCRNLEELAVGVQREAVLAALECAREGRKLLLERIREGATPSVVGEVLNLEALEGCENLFL